MSKTLIISDNNQKIIRLTKILAKIQSKSFVCEDENSVLSNIEKLEPQIIILDMSTDFSDMHILVKKIRFQLEGKKTLLLLLINQSYMKMDTLKLASGVLYEPINETITLLTINNLIKNNENMTNLAKSNTELTKSLIQINSLYNTSTKLAGTLDKNRLLRIMIEGLDLSLSFSLVYVLFFDTNGTTRLIIDSLNGISHKFEEALKLRATLSYKNLFENKKTPFEIKNKNITVSKTVKNDFEEYDLGVFGYDSMFAPIQIGEKFFGVVEIFRKKEFTSEDATCFQTLISQVALPIESAILYEEIKNTNTKLEKLEQLKSEFISIVSHELRTPLTPIKNALDIILSGKAGAITDKISNFANLANRNVTRLAGIINDLLDLSKVEAGRLEFHYDFCDINPIAEFVKKTFENMAKEKGIQLLLELDNALEPIYIDDKRVEQILANLVSNAIKFTPENGTIQIKTCTINAHEIDKTKIYEHERFNIAGNYILVSVKDSGIGVDPEDKHQVFDKFKQIENSLSRKTGGTGLGLSIAKQFVEAHSGFIWLESEVNKGCEFFFTIPVLSARDVFLKDFEKALGTAKTKNVQLGLIHLEENNTQEGFSLIDDIKEEKLDVVRKTQHNKEYFGTKENKPFYDVFIIDADKFALDFIEKKIQAYCDKNRKSDEKCDIVLSKTLFPDNGTNVTELMQYASENLEGLRISEGENG